MPYPYDKTDLANKFSLPSAEHLFGTDDLGRDVFSRLIYGARYSLQIGFISVFTAGILGTLLGSFSGYYGGIVDLIVMRLLDVFQAIPGLIFAIAVCATLGPGFTNCIISLAVGLIPGYARLARASILNIRKMEYLEAAESINANVGRIIIKHIIPNILSPLIVQATLDVANAILVAASLSFIGLGVRPPTPEWGAMLTAGRDYLRTYPHLVMFPGLTIMIAVISLNMLGDGLRDALDPKLRR